MYVGGEGSYFAVKFNLFKTTELFRRVRRYLAADKTCLIIKHSNDIRYCFHNSVTHDGQEFPSVSAPTIEEGVKGDPSADVIGIDEGQFFPDLVKMCDRLANEGKIVIVAALDGNYKREPFENTLGLLAKAEEVIKLSAVCMQCFSPSSFSKRITDEEDEIVVGGKDKYETVCRRCYHGNQ